MATVLARGETVEHWLESLHSADLATSVRSLIEPAAPQRLTRDGRALRIEMKLADPPITGMTSLKGVAVSEDGWNGSDGRKAINAYLKDHPVEPGATASSDPPVPAEN